MSGKTVGIDLGTTNSVIAVLENGDPVVIGLAEGVRLCPSVVGFTRTGERLVGGLAKRQAITAPERTVSSIKRHMGDAAHRVVIDGTEYSPSEISAMVLQKLKNDAEAYLGEPVTQAVVTVPAYFNDGQRQATKDAGRIAGLEVLRIINEPTAAALAYGLDKTDPHNLLVWDLGGGTFDVTILRIGGDGTFTVKSTSGDTLLGGDDWDERVIDELVNIFEQQTGIDLRSDKIAMQRLKDAGEKAKTELSILAATHVNLPFLAQTPSGPAHLDHELTRVRLEQITSDLRERLLVPTRQALSDAKMTPDNIDRVVLVGGSTRMPAVQDMVREFFGKEPFRGTNPDEVVALGAAVQAGILTGEKNLVLLDVTPLSLGVETVGGLSTRLIGRNSAIPTSRTEIFTTGEDGQNAVDIHVVQGEREMAEDNRSLGRFVLSGIPPAPRGLPKIAVTFEIDANGIVHVSAKDSMTGQARRVQVQASGGLTQTEVEKMVAEAVTYADTDRQKRERQETINAADALLYGAYRTIREAEKKGGIDSALLGATRDALAALRRTLSETDVSLDALKTSANKATDALYALSHELYRADGSASLLGDIEELDSVPTPKAVTRNEKTPILTKA
jgi:molecular chaperone DnaK